MRPERESLWPVTPSVPAACPLLYVCVCMHLCLCVCASHRVFVFLYVSLCVCDCVFLCVSFSKRGAQNANMWLNYTVPVSTCCASTTGKNKGLSHRAWRTQSLPQCSVCLGAFPQWGKIPVFWGKASDCFNSISEGGLGPWPKRPPLGPGVGQGLIGAPLEVGCLEWNTSNWGHLITEG